MTSQKIYKRKKALNYFSKISKRISEQFLNFYYQFIYDHGIPIIQMHFLTEKKVPKLDVYGN